MAAYTAQDARRQEKGPHRGRSIWAFEVTPHCCGDPGEHQRVRGRRTPALPLCHAAMKLSSGEILQKFCGEKNYGG